jgi:hypothetical protein
MIDGVTVLKQFMENELNRLKEGENYLILLDRLYGALSALVIAKLIEPDAIKWLYRYYFVKILNRAGYNGEEVFEKTNFYKEWF